MIFKSKKYNWISYILPPILVTIAILVVYYLKGIYPFGSMTIIDNDFGASEIPVIYHVYNFLHGDTSLFFSWATGTGLSRTAIASLFDPFQYVMTLLNRDNLYYTVSYIIVAKFALISFTAFMFFKKTFENLPYYWCVLFSLIYSLCGYNLQYYTNLTWLNFVAVFPLLVLATKSMFEGKRFLPFVICLSYCLITNAYFCYFAVFSLIFIGGSYVFTFLEKEKQPNAIFKLGMGVFSSIVLSAFSLIPNLKTILFSSRFSSGVDDSSILDTVKDVFFAKSVLDPNKIFMLLGLEVTIVMFVMLLSKFKKDKNHITFFLFSTVVLVLQIVFENINLIWHVGSYRRWSFRNGYMLAFILCLAAAYYLQKYDVKRKIVEKYKIFAYLKPSLAVISFYAIIPFYLILVNSLKGASILSYLSLMTNLSVISKFAYAFLAVILGCILIQTIKVKKLRDAFLAILIIIVLSLNTYALIGARESNDVSITEQYILDSIEIGKVANNDNPLERISNVDSSLINNYPVIMGRSAISDWTHLIDQNLRASLMNLGFTIGNPALCDSGGTAFTKGLLNVKDTVSKVEMNNQIYTLNSKLDNGFYYYDNNYTIPLGQTFNKDTLSLDVGDNLFEYQNKIYKQLLNTDESLLMPANVLSENNSMEARQKEDETVKGYIRSYNVYIDNVTINVDEKCELYFYLDNNSNLLETNYGDDSCTIKINGEDFNVLEMSNPENKIYRTGNNNNILSFGVYENEDVKIEVTSGSDITGQVVLYTLPLDKMEKLKSLPTSITSLEVGNSSLDITAISKSEGEYLFLPIYNGSNWNCKVNGQDVEIENIFGAFMAVPLESGENTIQMKYIPKEFCVGAVISALSLIIFATVMIIIKKKKAEPPKWMLKTFNFAFIVVFVGSIAIFYVIPLCIQIYMCI